MASYPFPVQTGVSGGRPPAWVRLTGTLFMKDAAVEGWQRRVIPPQGRKATACGAFGLPIACFQSKLQRFSPLLRPQAFQGKRRDSERKDEKGDSTGFTGDKQGQLLNTAMYGGVWPYISIIQTAVLDITRPSICPIRLWM